MSAKKKTLLSKCDACGCTVLTKDYTRHNDICSSPPINSEISILQPHKLMKGFNSVIDKLSDHIPPDATGWMRSHSVLIHPQMMQLLGVVARQAIRVILANRILIAVVWPCKELGVMRICVSSRDSPKEKMVILEPLFDTIHTSRVSLSLQNTDLKPDHAIQEFIQMYLCNCYMQVGIPIHMSYYGRPFQVLPLLPIENQLKQLTVSENDQLSSSNMVLYLQSGCSVVLSGVLEHTFTPTSHSSLELSSIGGMHNIKDSLFRYVIDPFKRDGSCCSVLVWGLPGSGKSLLLSTVAQLLASSAFYFQSMDEFVEQYSMISNNCIVILDWATVDKEHRSYHLLTQLLTVKKNGCVILSVRQADDLDLGIRVRFPIEEEVTVPVEVERLEILCCLTGCPADEGLKQLAKRTHGFTGGDLNSVVTAARFAEGLSMMDRLERARQRVRPTGIRQFILEVPDVRWDDIGGNEELKEEIQQAVIWPQKHGDAFERLGVDPPAGILLYGPPGCSKTLVARALANESKMNFLAVKGPELFNKWVGESEKAIRDLFARARQVAPTIVFFDEIDAVGASRGSESSSGVSDRVLAQLLTELDGLVKKSGVILLAATNRPDQLDSALLRPGRLDRSIYVGLPSASTRRAVLSMRTKRMRLADDVSMDHLVDKTEGYSGAELVAVCRNAALVAMREDVDAQQVYWKHFQDTLTHIVPRTEKRLLDIYEHFKVGCVV